jgi:hypothetical protein
MKHVINNILTVVLLALFAGAIVPPQSAAESTAQSGVTRDIRDREVRRALTFMFNGQVPEALDYLASLEPTCGGEPLYLLIRARVVRE